MRTDVTEAVWILASSVYCVAVQIVSLFWLSVGCFVIFEDSRELEGTIVAGAGALQLNSHHLISSHIDRSIKRGCMACRSVNGRESHRAYEGEGEKGVRERREGGREGGRSDCSVVVYVSLRSCVGRSAPSRHCCCCEKRQNKGLPTLWNPYTFAGSAVLWSHPDGMLLKLTILRSTAGVNWAGRQSVTRGKKETEKQTEASSSPPHIFGPVFLGSSAFLSWRVATADKVSIPSLKVWHGHCCGLFVEGVAVDTDGREAALKPEARVNKPPAAESAAMEQMRLN